MSKINNTLMAGVFMSLHANKFEQNRLYIGMSSAKHNPRNNRKTKGKKK